MKSYKELIGKHKGETAFVVGAGTSLKKAMDMPEFGHMHEHVVISVNSSILAMPWADGDSDKRYWISNDSATRYWSYWQNVLDYKANKLVRDSWEPYYEEVPNFHIFKPRTGAWVNDAGHGLVPVSSVPSAIDLAIQMGCKRVYLVGVDHYFVADKSHFWQLWPKDKQPTTVQHFAPKPMQRKIFGDNMAFYELINGFAMHSGAKVHNLNHRSKVLAFEFLRPEEIEEFK